MAFQLNEGQGTLFQNEKKVKGSQQPDYRGELNVHGAIFELSGWKRIGKKSNKPYLSLTIKPKEAYEGHRPRPNDGEEEVPF